MILIYDLEKRGKHPLYEYLYICLREDILNGRLQAGDKLPSKREMARSHKLSLITVENAYAQLQIEGYIYSKEKSGYYVEKSAAGIQKRTEQPELGTGRQEGTVQKKQNVEEIIVDFSSSDLKKDAFPFATWAKLTRRIMADRENAFLVKPDRQGVLELRFAIAEYLIKTRGLNADPERIIIGPGTEYLHQILLQILGRSRIVAVEDPGYKKVGRIYEGNGLKCLYIPVDQGGMIIQRLAGSNASLVHISPAHHFPTGCVMPIGRRRDLLGWAREQEAFIIEDDYDSEFRFDGRPIPTLASLDGKRVIYMNTFTRSLAPSIRIAYMFLPEELMKLYHRRLSYYSGAVSSFEQYTLAEFIANGYYERHISRMRNYYRVQRAKIMSCLEDSPLAEKVTVEEHSAGLHFILHVKGIRDDEAWLDKLRKRGVRLQPVADYCYERQERYRHRFVIYYSDLETDRIREAFRIMSET